MCGPGFPEQIHEEIRDHSAYARCVRRVAIEGGMSEDQARDYSDRYVRAILTAALHEEITEEVVRENALRFARDVNYLPTEWTIAAWLAGTSSWNLFEALAGCKTGWPD